MNERGKQAVTRAVRRAINEAVISGAIEPDDGLAVLVSVAAGMVAQVPDEKQRQVYVDHVVVMFPDAVAYAAGNHNALLAHEAELETMQ